MRTQRWWRQWRVWLVAALAVIALLEVVSFLVLDKSNPAVVAEPNWDTPRTRELAKAACFDCHSNETVWPWYANLAPASWLLWRDVDEGRDALNFSEWTGRGEVDEIAEVINEGEMPPSYYVWMHSDAKLSDAEKQELISGLLATLGQSGGEESPDGDDDDD